MSVESFAHSISRSLQNVSIKLELVTGNQLTDAPFFALLVRVSSGAGSSEFFFMDYPTVLYFGSDS